MTQVLATKTPVQQVALSPMARVKRDAMIVSAAFGMAQPILIGALHMTGSKSAALTAVVSGITMAGSALHNLLEHLGWIPVAGGQAPVTAPSPAPSQLILPSSDPLQPATAVPGNPPPHAA